jgi:hypothetical protein
MPKLPSSTDLGERPDTRVGGGVASYNVDANSTAPGLALAQAGKGLSQVGDAFYRQVEEEEGRINTIKAEEAFNKLRERQLDLTVGNENGFLNRRGADAINTPLLKDYSTKFEQATKDVEATLANDKQRELYRKRAGVSSLQFREDLLKHLHREGDTYSKQVYEGGVNVEVRNATARWQDPEAVWLSLERINGLIAAEAERGGWSPEQTEAERLKRVSQVHSTVIGQAIATDNYTFAQQWYEQNKDDIDPATAKAVQKAVEDGAQKQTYADHTRDFLGVQDDAKGLAALHAKVMGDPRLDDTRKNALLGRIQARQGVLEHRAEANARKIESRVSRAISDARANLMAGFEPTPEQLSPIINAARGTELERDAAILVASANASRVFRGSLPAAQEQMIAQAEATLRQDPAKFDRQLLESWKTIHENQKRRVAESPITYGVQQGLIDPKSPAARPLDLSRPIEAMEGLTARFETARAFVRTHNAPFKPLTPEETSLVVNNLKGATVPQKREWFGQLAQASNGDYEGYSAVMAQIAPDAPVIAIAGEYAGKGRTQAADLLLRGESILRPNRKEDGTPDGGRLYPMPPERDMRRIFDDSVRDAFAGRPNARSDHFQAARAIYAALSADSSDRDTQILDTKRWEKSIEMATGGLASYGGKRIPLPYGMDTSNFRDGLARRVDDLLASGRLKEQWTRGKLLDLPLEAVGDGRYKFKVGDADLVAPKNFGSRPDGTPKGAGFLGVLRRPDGGVSTEISIGVNIDGKEIEIPTIVPTLSRDEVQQVLRLSDDQKIPEPIVQKAVAFARERMKAGKPVFATPDESPLPTEPVIIDFNTSAAFRTSGHGLRAAAEEPTPAELAEAAQPATGRALKRKAAAPQEPRLRAVDGRKVPNDTPSAPTPGGGVRG